MSVTQLLESRLLFVTGKGGTGKTSLSAAVGRLCAERGHRTVIAEVDSHRPALSAMLGTEPAYEPTAVSDRLYICNISWRDALVEWLERAVPVQRIVRLILGNRIVQVFLNATPGVRETVIFSRILSLTEEFERVIVDMPASGHAVSLLRVPHIALTLMRGGPIRERSEEVVAALGKSTTRLVIVGLPEEMVVNETVELWERVHAVVPELQLGHVVLNRAATPTLADDERTLLSRLSVRFDQGGVESPNTPEAAAWELLLAGRWEASLEVATAESLGRLEAEVKADLLQFPRLGALGGFERGPAQVVRQMSAALARIQVREGGQP